MAERCTRAVPYSALAFRDDAFSRAVLACLPAGFLVTPCKGSIAKSAVSLMFSSAFVYEGQTLSQRSGAPGQHSGGRAGGGKQPQFTCGVKRNRLRASPAVRTVCPEQTGFCAARAKAMSQAEFTSAVSKARSVQAPQPVQRVQRRRAFVLRGRRRKGAKA